MTATATVERQTLKLCVEKVDLKAKVLQTSARLPRGKMFELNINDRRPISYEEARRRYTKRFTMEHMPAWAKKRLPNGKYPAPKYANDLEWYTRTEFIGEGTLNVSRYIRENQPSYPIGRYLPKPYKPEDHDWAPAKDYRIKKAEAARFDSVAKYAVSAPEEPEAKKPAAEAKVRKPDYPAKKAKKQLELKLESPDKKGTPAKKQVKKGTPAKKRR